MGSSDDASDVSVIIPARNEAQSIAGVVHGVMQAVPGAQVIVVDDGSTDGTGALAAQAGATVVAHRVGLGNGAAVKAGVRSARGGVLVFLDGDGQHDPADIPRLLAKLEEGFDMVVGARDAASQASLGRRLANGFYNRLAGYMTNQRVEDLTSGFRAARANRFREFLFLLPNGFSYPTTSTMAFFRAGYQVTYIPIRAAKRVGQSHIRLFKDGIRFLLIIFRIGSLYSPLKLFAPLALAFFLLGAGWYGYTLSTEGRFTNMSALMFTTSVIVFMMGLVSEQITALMYKDSGQKREAG